MEQGRADGTLRDRGTRRWHALTSGAVIEILNTTAEGLSATEAESRLGRFGPNAIPEGKLEGPLTLLWRQINNPLIWVLIVSGGISITVDPTGGVKNGLVILAVVALNSIIGFVQEYGAGRAIDELQKMVPESTTVLRAGTRSPHPVESLVPGDVVLLAAGDQVPADIRVLKARAMQVEEAALTGESVPVAKAEEPVPEAAELGDRSSMLYAGTLVVAGSVTGVVVQTGARTELGRISDMLTQTMKAETPLTRALGQIGLLITVGIVILGGLILLVGAWRTVTETGVSVIMGLRETVIFGIALAVGAIPEGLPAIVTIALAIGVRRMAKRRAVVRKLPAVETLGSTTVICTDKTGTLTKNEMTVQRIHVPNRKTLRVSGVGYEPAGELLDDGEPTAPDEVVLKVLEAGVLCGDATLSNERGVWRIQGDPTEGALVVAARKLGLDPDAVVSAHPRLDEIPFDPSAQYMATLHEGATPRIVLKGSPEVVMARCSGAASGPLDLSGLQREVDSFGALGLRVLAFAEKAAHGRTQLEPRDVDSGFTFLGLQAMMDPPRPEAVEAVRRCREAGTTVKMVTGDHRITAGAVARAVGIGSGDQTAPSVLVGNELDAMSDEDLERAVTEYHVFARVAPEHKLKLVRALQRQGEVVAMTGDGVNDAPALKQANIGVAMGLSGTNVARAAADLVLTDDNFASIAAAVEEGRRVYDNIIKSLAFVLPTNIALAAVLAWAVAFFPFVEVVHTDGTVADALLLPIAPVQLLWINLVAAVALALPLAFEAMEPDIMKRPPRDPEAPVLNRFVTIRTVVITVLVTAATIILFNFELEAHEVGRATAIANAQTIAVTTVVAFQIVYLWGSRSFRLGILEVGLFGNPMVFSGSGVTILLMALFIYAPILNTVFESQPLPPLDLLGAVAVATLAIPVLWALRRVVRS